MASQINGSRVDCIGFAWPGTIAALTMKLEFPLTRNNRCGPRLAQHGFSLLEVLVAIVVLSFGVLGIVGLQAASMQANTDARYQSAGVRLGFELGDMMRDNKNVSHIVVPAPSGQNPYLVPNYTGPATLPGVPPTDCSQNACATGQQLAQFQIYEWLQRVSAELPGARVEVCYDPAPYDLATGLPQWSPTGCAVLPPISTAGMAVMYVKIGWTRASTNRAATGSSGTGPALDQAVRPAVVVAVNPEL